MLLRTIALLLVLTMTAGSLIQGRTLALFTNQAQAPGNDFTTAYWETLTSVADSHVKEDKPTTNEGDKTTMEVRSETGGKNARSFVQFDVSAIPSGNEILKAELTLCADQVPTATRAYYVHRVTAGWGETTITWSNQPAIEGTATASATTPATVACMTWPVAPDVQAWVAGVANNGWRVSDSVESSATQFKTRFRTREDTVVPTDRPELYVVYRWCQDATAPAVPTNLVATPGNTQVGLNWSDNTELDLAGYNIYRSTTQGGPYNQVNGGLVATSNYTDTGLTNGTTYYYVVTAQDNCINESGSSNETSATPVVTPPAAPTGLGAVGGDLQVALDWDDNGEPDLAGYNVYRSTTTGGPYSKVNGALVATSDYSDIGLTAGTTYYYVVTAENTSALESGYSNEANATPADLPPAAPTGLGAAAGDTEVTLDWDDNTEFDLAGYNVYRSTTQGGPYTQINGTLVTPSSYTDTGLTNNTTYYYVVTAVDNGTNESGYSTEAGATPLPTLYAVADSHVKEDKPTTNEGTKTTMDVTTFVGKHARAFAQFDLSSIPAGATINSATLALCATQVSGAVRTYNVHRVTASWVETTITWSNQPAVAGAATDSATAPVTLGCMTWTVTADVQAWVNGTANNGWRISDSAEGSAIEYKTRFRSREDTAVPSERPKLQVDYTPDVTPPGIPANLAAMAGDTEVSLDWDNNPETDLAGYNVYRSTTQGGPYSKVNGALVATSAYTDTGLTAGTTYYYVVTAQDYATNESGYSSEASATPFDLPPAAPTNLAAAAGSTIVALDWDDNTESDLVGYNVYRSTTQGGPYGKVNGALVTTSDYTDTGLTNDTTYYYVVTAEDNGTNESGYSNEASATPAAVPPAAPTGLLAMAGDLQVSLDWNDNGEPDLVGYNVYRSTTQGGPYTKVNGALLTTSDYTDTGLSAGTTYYYVVTAENTSALESGYSNEASATPTVTFFSVADSQVKEDKPDRNEGTKRTMEVKSSNNGVGKNARVFVQFDLSSIAAGSTINSATLTLCATQIPAATRTYNVHQVTASWVETTITWGNQPTVAGAATDSAATPATVGCMTWDVTADVQAWVDGTANNGWRVSDSAENDVTGYKTKFRSREDTTVPDEQPKLEVDYTAP